MFLLDIHPTLNKGHTAQRVQNYWGPRVVRPSLADFGLFQSTGDKNVILFYSFSMKHFSLHLQINNANDTYVSVNFVFPENSSVIPTFP